MSRRDKQYRDNKEPSKDARNAEILARLSVGEAKMSAEAKLARVDRSVQRRLDEAFRHEHPPGPSGYCACSQCLGLVE